MENTRKNKNRLGLIIGGAILLLFGLMAVVSYNGIISAENKADEAWGNVETSYQRRADLVPNLSNIVERSSEREGDILGNVTKARTDAKKSVPTGDTEALSSNQSGLNSILVNVEDYPELKSTAGYKDFQTQLEGTENRIYVNRQDYNDAAREYNNKISTFPGSIFASFMGKEKINYFEADEGADEAPDVDFGK